MHIFVQARDRAKTAWRSLTLLCKQAEHFSLFFNKLNGRFQHTFNKLQVIWLEDQEWINSVANEEVKKKKEIKYSALVCSMFGDMLVKFFERFCDFFELILYTEEHK